MGVLYGTDDIETARRHEQSCHMDYPKALQPGTLPVLHRLHRAGLSIGVVTATSRFSFDHDVESLGIPGSLFSYLQTEEDTDCHKPDPRVVGPLQSWLELRGIRPREVLYVGDGLHDMAAAAGAGFNFAGVATGLVTLDQFQDAGGAAIRTLSELFPSPGQWRWEAACSQAL
jgi:phosphoglycolate phosphatase-like HAD superfamily hydrolase